MNTLERRVSEQLRAFGEGLDMTTQDIDRLERQLEQKQETSRKQRRRRIWQAAVAACAVTAVVLGALALRNDAERPKAPAGPPSLTITDLAGIWRVDGDTTPWLWSFTADGKLTHVEVPEAWTGTDSEEWTFTPAPGGFTEVSPGGDTACHATWAATISPDGRMRATVKQASATCGVQPGPDVWAFTRISPVSLAGATMSSNWPSSSESKVTQPAQLHGTWLLKGTGTVLAVNDSGRFVVQDLGQPDGKHSGSVTVQKDGSVLLPGLNGLGCTVVYRSMTTRNNTLEAARPLGTDCGLPDAPSHTWIRLN